MFDPSKLNLDIDDKKENVPASKEEIKKALESVNTIKSENVNNLSTEGFYSQGAPRDPLNDVKGNLVIENTSTQNSISDINKAFIESEEKKDAIKEIKKEVEEKVEEKKAENIVGDISGVINMNKRMQKIEEKSNTIIGNANLIDINIKSLEDILNILIKNKYDLFILEPRDDDVKISFRESKVEKDVKYIKFPIYNQILLKAKALNKLKVEETKIDQDGKGEIQIKDKKYSTIAKTVPSAFGEKILLKIEETKKKIEKKEKEKTPLSKILGLLGIIAIVALIIGGGFISFIVMNAKTMEDIQFFVNLKISLNNINTFIATSVKIIFSILIFIETIFLAIYLFKALLTKKIYKRKKVLYTILSLFVFIITFSTGIAWMAIDEKIRNLPNWQDMANGEIQVFDNSKLNNVNFGKDDSLLKDTGNMIGPISLKYDLTYWSKNQKGFDIEKYNWSFGDKSKITTEPNTIHVFDEKGIFEIKVIVTGKDIKGKEKIVEINDIKNVEIANLVEIEEEIDKFGLKTVSFDARDLDQLGKVQWYEIRPGKKDHIEELETKYIYRPNEPINEEKIYGIGIWKNGKKPENIEKIFIIKPPEKNNIKGKIIPTPDIINEKKYTFKVENPETSRGNGFIENFKWEIEGRTYDLDSNKHDIEESSKIIHIFKKSGKQEITVTMTDGTGKTRTLKTTINVVKKVRLIKGLEIKNNGKFFNGFIYKKNIGEYLIEDLPAPTRLSFNAKRIKPKITNYKLVNVGWDTNEDGKIDVNKKQIFFPVNTGGDFIITAYYKFQHTKKENDIINIEEKIKIESSKKDAILSLKIKADNQYAPTHVSFDASNTQIKGKNIQKFIYNYDDGTLLDERDAINPSHLYEHAGEYDIKLTVVTTDGSRYSTSKKLILKPQPQKVKITTSLKKAPIYQGINFMSNDSQGEIRSYYWDFGDGDVSTKANPIHQYETEGEYTVKLKATFSNRNILKDEIDIIISKE